MEVADIIKRLQELQIEEILEEANAYNLRDEVKDAAEKIYGEKNKS